MAERVSGDVLRVTSEKLEDYLEQCEQQRSLRDQETLHEQMCSDDAFDCSSEACGQDYPGLPDVAAMEADCDWEVSGAEDSDWQNDQHQQQQRHDDEDFSFSIVDSEVSSSASFIVDPDDYYSEEYYAWNCILEEKYYPGDSLTNQPQVKSENRATLVAWLSKVIRSLDLFPETLFLTVNIVDRFLGCTPIALECLQLVGLSALFVAAKQLEIYHPSVMELLKIGGGVYSRQHFLQMERIILTKLQFNLVVATTLFFVEYYITFRPPHRESRISEFHILLERPHRTMVRNLAELCVQDYNLCRYATSCVALSSMAVVEEYAVGQPADLTAWRYVRWGYEPSLLKQCSTDIWMHLSRVVHGSIRKLSEETFFEDYQPSPEVT